MTYTQAAAVTSLGTTFKDNTTITTFDELKEFGVTSLGENAFNGCISLTNVDLSKIISIGSSSFYNCTSLAIDDLSLPNLTYIGSGVFHGVKIKKISNLGKVEKLPSVNNTNVKNYGSVETLLEATLPDAITSIPANSFYGYKCLERVVARNVEVINDNAFNGCILLNDINLQNVKTIGLAAFQNCKLEGELSLPNASGDIGFRAFADTKITSVTTLGSITSLCSSTTWNNSGYGVFKGCKELESVILPESLKIIGRECFIKCSKLTSINIP